MTIQEAIQKAIEGGWDDINYAYRSANVTGEWLVGEWQYDSKIFIDPLFWQALGKALRWTTLKHGYMTDVHRPAINDSEWRYHWHKFIDALSEGKTIEEFFEQLTKH